MAQRMTPVKQHHSLRAHCVVAETENENHERKMTMDYYPRCIGKSGREEMCSSERTESGRSPHESFTIEMFGVSHEKEVVNCARCHASGDLWVEDRGASLIDKVLGMAVKQITCPVCGGTGKVRV
jgi:hypothetical protein